MQPYNVQQRAEIVKTLYQSKSSISNTLRKLKEKFGETKVPLNPTISSLINEFETFGSVADRPKSRRFRTAYIPENTSRTQESIEANQFNPSSCTGIRPVNNQFVSDNA